MSIRKTDRSKKRTAKKQSTQHQVGLPLRDVMRLHTEVPRDLKNLVDRVCLERKQSRLHPWTQSELVEEALWEWLIQNSHATKRERNQ